MTQQLNHHLHDTYLVEFVLSPTFTTPIGIRESSIPIVPWTYGRLEVPQGLAERVVTGVGSDESCWTKAVDSASQLWEERAVVLETMLKKHRQRVFPLLILFVGLVCLLLFYPAVSVFFSPPPYLFKILIACIAVNFVVLFDMHSHRMIVKSLRHLSESEPRWRDLVRELCVLFEPHGVSVEAVQAKFKYSFHVQVSWTVGLVFSFRMQPTNDDEVAWCIANCQTDAIPADEYQQRKLRVTKESHLLQRKR